MRLLLPLLLCSSCLDFAAAELHCYERGSCRQVWLSPHVERVTSAGVEPGSLDDLGHLRLLTRRPYEVSKLIAPRRDDERLVFQGVNPGPYLVNAVSADVSLSSETDGIEFTLRAIGRAGGEPPGQHPLNVADAGDGALWLVVPDEARADLIDLDAGVEGVTGDQAWLLSMVSAQQLGGALRGNMVSRFAQFTFPPEGAVEAQWVTPTHRSFHLDWPVPALKAFAPLAHPNATAGQVELELWATPFDAGPARGPHATLFSGTSSRADALSDDVRFNDPFDTTWQRWLVARHVFVLQTVAGDVSAALVEQVPLSRETTVASELHGAVNATLDGQPFAADQVLTQRSPELRWEWTGGSDVVFRVDIVELPSGQTVGSVWTEQRKLQLFPTQLRFRSCVLRLVAVTGSGLRAPELFARVEGARAEVPLLSGLVTVPADLPADAAP